MISVILDIGEGAALNGKHEQVLDMLWMIAELADDLGFPTEDILVKPQLFMKEPPNMPLDHEMFAWIAQNAKDCGFSISASVFDELSLEFLLKLEPDAVKIANRPYLRRLRDLIPRGIPVYTSIGASDLVAERVIRYIPDRNEHLLCCVSSYPAPAEAYEATFSPMDLWYWGLSDHTVGLDLFKKVKPEVYEKHFAMDWMKGPSVGPWSIGLTELREVLEQLNAIRLRRDQSRLESTGATEAPRSEEQPGS